MTGMMVTVSGALIITQTAEHAAKLICSQICLIDLAVAEMLATSVMKQTHQRRG
jgi:hypothetical protein